MIHVSELTENERPVWDDYVRQAKNGLPLHLSGWRDVLRQTHKYETIYLMARQENRVVGVLPLFRIRSFLVGHRLSTMPGGLCADDEAAAAALIDHGLEIARQARVKRFQIQDSRIDWPGPLQSINRHVHWTCDVRPEPDALWQALDSNIRRQVRIARRHNLQVKIDRTGLYLDTFYNVFSHFTHQIGTPVFGRNFLAQVIDTFPEGFNIAIVFQDQQPLGAYFQLQMGQTVYGMWGATLREHLKLRPVYLAYWEMLCDAHQQGYHFLDMGRSPIDSNAAKFKGQWGGICQPIYQQSFCPGADQRNGSQPDAVVSDGKMQWFAHIWPRLPHAVVQYLGPKLRHHVPFA